MHAQLTQGQLLAAPSFSAVMPVSWPPPSASLVPSFLPSCPVCWPALLSLLPTFPFLREGVWGWGGGIQGYQGVSRKMKVITLHVQCTSKSSQAVE